MSAIPNASSSGSSHAHVGAFERQGRGSHTARARSRLVVPPISTIERLLLTGGRRRPPTKSGRLGLQPLGAVGVSSDYLPGEAGGSSMDARPQVAGLAAITGPPCQIWLQTALPLASHRVSSKEGPT